MSDAIPHPSHRSADSCSAGGLGECWSRPSGPTLSVDVRKPFRSTFRTSVTHTWPRSGGSLVVYPAWLWEVEVGASGRAGVSNVGRKGCIRVSLYEHDGTGTSPQPAPARCLLERVCGDRLRLASPPVRATRIPRGQTRPLSTVGCRPLDRRPDLCDFSGQSMSLADAGGAI
jgi:hypothetical protein